MKIDGIEIWILAFTCGFAGFVVGYIIAALPKWLGRFIIMIKEFNNFYKSIK